ncbi:MAG: OmpA family protein, partial [archaeon]|nr:OmpA family protein [archaeon]
DYLSKNSELRFEIIGHTDLHGTEEFNDKLSLERAQAVKDYLAGRGLDEKRFIVKGAGESQPIVPKIGQEFDEKNRRTEFKLLDQ